LTEQHFLVAVETSYYIPVHFSCRYKLPNWCICL